MGALLCAPLQSRRFGQCVIESSLPDAAAFGSNDMGITFDKAVEATVKRDRIVVLGALAVVIALSWAYLLAGAGMDKTAVEMTRLTSGRGVVKMLPVVWDIGHAGVMFVMWWVMMIAMMLPAATPMVLLFATVNRKQMENGNPYVATTLFASAYLIAWAGFSFVAVALQWGLEALTLLSPTLISGSVFLGAGILLAAGIYQVTPFKQACLKNCRSPLQFIMTHWRNGPVGALRMGIEHGAYCVGCCWFLMGLLFFGGVMNLYWIIGLALFVLLEKTIPVGHWLSTFVGVALIACGTMVLLYAY
jgi:predicted metal-binding membrane protein